MVTNVVIERPMGDLTVLQRTKDGMFNATALINAWNNAHPQQKRLLDNFWKSTNLNEFMSELAKNELDFNTVEFTELKKALTQTSTGKYNGGTWMHPILFIKFATYLSPSFEYHVYKFVYDQMIQYRKDAGDAYKRLSSAVSLIVSSDMMRPSMKKVAEAINWIVFGKHETEIRNKHGEEKLQKELFDLERKVAELIEDGFIRNYDQLVNYLRKTWQKKHLPPILNT